MNESPVRYFYDTEFIDDGHTIELISIGIVGLTDWQLLDPDVDYYRPDYAREYYAVNADAPIDHIKGNRWLMRNVLPHLPVVNRGVLDKRLAHSDNVHPQPSIDLVDLDRADTCVKPHWVIANEVRDFILAPLAEADDDAALELELWADYAAYDHVALAQLWGSMVKLPAGIPMYTNDFQQFKRYADASAHQLAERLPVQQPEDEHNALADARHLRAQFEAVLAIERDND